MGKTTTTTRFNLKSQQGTTVITGRRKLSRHQINHEVGKAAHSHIDHHHGILLTAPVCIGRLERPTGESVRAHWSMGLHPLISMTVGRPKLMRAAESLLSLRLKLRLALLRLLRG